MKIIQKDSFDIIQRTVNKVVDLIRMTYGPASNKVVISKQLYKMVVDDGVQIARDIELDDEAENAIVQVIRETAVRTNDRVGDGTTSSLIMLQGIVNEVAKKANKNGRKIEKELKNGFEEAKEQLLRMAVPVKTRDELRKVARISFDDETISKIIADAWFELGKDGMVTVDRSPTMETYADITEGVSLNRGYLSPYMITNPSRMESVIEKPYILLTDYRLTEAQDIVPAMNALMQKGITNLVVIADNMEQSALATAIVNKMQGRFNVVAINIPSGDNKAVLLEDLAIMTGAKVFSEAKGDKLENIKIEDFGRAERFIAKRDSSVIISPKGKKTNVRSAIDSLRAAANTTKDETERKEIEKRLARFANKVAVIRVGAATENEEKALKYKVEDAVNATQAAFKGGVVCGAGLSLYRLVTSSTILNEALKMPFKQLKDNMGIEEHKSLGENDAINAVTGRVGNYMEVGVIDPVDVLIAGIESAVSIASLLVTTSGIIVEEKPKTKE